MENWLWAYKTGNISETVEDRAKATVNGLYEVVHADFRLPPKCMTTSAFLRHNQYRFLHISDGDSSQSRLRFRTRKSAVTLKRQ